MIERSRKAVEKKVQVRFELSLSYADPCRAEENLAVMEKTVMCGEEGGWFVFG